MPLLVGRFLWLKMSWLYPSSLFSCEWELKVITAILSSLVLFIFLSDPGRWKPTVLGTVWVMEKQPTACLEIIPKNHETPSFLYTEVVCFWIFTKNSYSGIIILVGTFAFQNKSLFSLLYLNASWKLISPYPALGNSSPRWLHTVMHNNISFSRWILRSRISRSLTVHSTFSEVTKCCLISFIQIGRNWWSSSGSCYKRPRNHHVWFVLTTTPGSITLHRPVGSCRRVHGLFGVWGQEGQWRAVISPPLPSTYVLWRGNLSHDATCKYAHINRRRRLLDPPGLIETIEVCCGACCYKHAGNLHKYVTL